MNPGALLLDLLFPPRCPYCGGLLKPGEGVPCPACQTSLPWALGEEGERTGEFFALCAAPLWYRGPVPDSLHRFKFGGQKGYAKSYAVLMAQCVSDRLAGRYDLITWVPLSSKRLRERGYDQSRLLAEHMAAHLGEQALPLLEKRRNTPAQSGITGDSARRANVQGAYALYPGAELSGQRVLLVDDIITTGSTLSECARTLLAAGAEEVVCTAAARAR